MSEALTSSVPAESLPAGITPPSGRAVATRRIGDVIVELGFAQRSVVEGAAARSRESGRPTGSLLVEEGIVTPDQLARAVAERFGVDHVDLSVFEVDASAAARVPGDVARNLRIAAIARLDQRTLLVVTADGDSFMAIDDLAKTTGFEIRKAIASPGSVDALLDRLYREVPAAEAAPAANGDSPAAPASAADMLRSLLSQAGEQGATDVHLDPGAEGLEARARVDGVVRPLGSVPAGMAADLVSHLKELADLEVTERRRPQQGHAELELDGHRIELGVSSLPTVAGEALVVRLRDEQAATLGIDALGLEPADRGRLTDALNRPHGAIVVAGPAASGISTTLLAALSLLSSPERTLVAVEDPVERRVEGVRHVDAGGELGFPASLVAALHADPDVLMVDALRDPETARGAVEAAVGGNLVLAGLGADSAAGALGRLVQMGLEPYLVASGVHAVVAQRLARRLCDCRRAAEVAEETLVRSGFSNTGGPVAGFEPVGCESCGASGYRGRVGIFEVLDMTDEIGELVAERRPARAVAAMAAAQGATDLRSDGLAKVRQGLTSVAEVLRVVGPAL